MSLEPFHQSLLFAIPLVCGAVALVLGGIFRRSSALRFVLVLLTVLAGVSASGLILIGLLSVPKLEVYQSGFRTSLSTTDQGQSQAGFWSPVPWALPKTSGAAVEICGLGGGGQKRSLLARQTQRSQGQLIVDFPSRPGKRVDLEPFTSPINGDAELTHRGEVIKIAWREVGSESSVVITYSNGRKESLSSSSIRFPKALRLKPTNAGSSSGLYLTRSSKDRDQEAQILVLSPDLRGPSGDESSNEQSFLVNGKPFLPKLEFSSSGSPKYMRVTRWNTVQKRFQNHVFSLDFERDNLQGTLLDISRFDRLRLPQKFLQREDTTHFIVSDWLYQNPTPSPSQLGSGHVGSVENRLSKYDASNRAGTQVALTFDDGPVPTNTPKVLDTLRANGILATFFVRGDNAKRYPELMKRIRQEGHEIGNHSWDHSSIWYLKTDWQIKASNDVIAETGGLPRFFRPPYGAMGKNRKWLATKIANDYNLETVFWSVDPQEFRSSKSDDEVIQSVVRDIHDGAIVLMHDINSKTTRTLPEIVKNLKRQKVEFLTLSELRNVSKGKVVQKRSGPIRLPTVTGLPSYLTLPYLPADTGGASTRLEIGEGGFLKLLSKESIKQKSGGVWELPVRSGGTVFLQTNQLGPTAMMIAVAALATIIAIIAVLKFGNMLGAFIVAVLGLVLTRLVLALSADHVFPDNVNLWSPPLQPSANWLVENTTTIAVLAPILICAMILPAVVLGLQDTVGNKLIGGFRLRKWFGFIAGFFGLLVVISAVWLLGGGERIGPVQKSAFYLPLIILSTAWIVGVGGVRGAQSRTPTERCWPVFAALFFILACVHGMFAVFRQDLGAILVLLPSTWLFICYASNQASWAWRGLLWILAGLAVFWGIRFISSFLSAIHFDDYPLEIIPDVFWIKIALGVLLFIITLLILRSLPNKKARQIGLPILFFSILAAVGMQFIPINSLARKIIIPKSESQKEGLYSQYLRFRSVDRDFLSSEGTQRAMEISEEQKIVDVYGMGGWFGDGFGTLPFDRSRYNFLNDYLVSTFIRGQFGLTGVLALAAWQLALLFYSTGLTIPKNTRKSRFTARKAFWESAGRLSCWVIGFISIYMIVSNLGFPWAPLTGKNVFLLGLNSSSDVLESSILIFIISAAAAVVQKERRSPSS